MSRRLVRPRALPGRLTARRLRLRRRRRVFPPVVRTIRCQPRRTLRPRQLVHLPAVRMNRRLRLRRHRQVFPPVVRTTRCQRKGRVSRCQRQRVARMSRRRYLPVDRTSRHRCQLPVRPLLLCRPRPASACHRHFRNRLTTRRRYRPADLPAPQHLSKATHRRRHPRTSRLRTVTPVKCQRRAVAGTGLVRAALRADTRSESHPMVRNRMNTAMAVRGERTNSSRPGTTRTGSRKQMMASSARIRSRLPSCLPRRQTELFSGRGELPMELASGHHQRGEMDRQTCLRLHTAERHWRACWSETVYRHRSGALTTRPLRHGGRRSPNHMPLTLEVRFTQSSDRIFVPVMCGKRSSFHD